MSALTLVEAEWRPSPALVWDVGILSAVLGCAHGLKTVYTTAAPEELEWILAPTARLVELMTGSTFTSEAHVGFVSRELATLIVPACAGVNFLVIALCMLAFTLVPRERNGTGKTGLVLGSAAVAYAATVMINATRITLGIVLREPTHALGLGTHADVHRALGVVVYLGALWLLFVVSDRVTRRAP